MKAELVKLPEEVNVLANQVSKEAKEEVQSVLNHVFNGISKMREQLEVVSVEDENDTINMQLAKTIRLGVKNERLSFEKKFDAKRSEVQAKMIGFKTEDSLWLKAKQTMQIMTKELEEIAKYKEETKNRIETERHELKINQRIFEAQKYNPEITRTDVEFISDEVFESVIAGLKATFDAKVEAEKKAEEKRIETERIEKLHIDRKNKTSRLIAFINNYDSIEFGTLSEKDYSELIDKAIKNRAAKELEDEKIRKENEQLKIQAEAKEKQRLFELEQAEKLAEKQRIEQEKERQFAAAKLKKQQEESNKLAAQLKAKEEAERKAKEAEKLAAKQAASAPDKEKLIKAISDCLLELPKCKEDSIEATAKMINDKFKAFKTWAFEQINNQ